MECGAYPLIFILFMKVTTLNTLRGEQNKIALMIKINQLTRLTVLNFDKYKALHDRTKFKNETEYLNAVDPDHTSPQETQKKEDDSDPHADDKPTSSSPTKKKPEPFSSVAKSINDGFLELARGYKIPPEQLAPLEGKIVNFAIHASKKAGASGSDLWHVAMEALGRVTHKISLAKGSADKTYASGYRHSQLFPSALIQYKKEHPLKKLEDAKKDPMLMEIANGLNPNIWERAWSGELKPNKPGLKSLMRYKGEGQKAKNVFEAWSAAPNRGSLSSYISRSLVNEARAILNEQEGDPGSSPKSLRIQPGRDDYAPGTISEGELPPSSTTSDHEKLETKQLRQRAYQLAHDKDPRIQILLKKVIEEGKDVASSADEDELSKAIGAESQRGYKRFIKDTFYPAVKDIFKDLQLNREDAQKLISAKSRRIIASILSHQKSTPTDWVAFSLSA